MQNLNVSDQGCYYYPNDNIMNVDRLKERIEQSDMHVIDKNCLMDLLEIALSHYKKTAKPWIPDQKDE